MAKTAEHARLEASRDRKTHWKRWGPYVSERAWGTVREDYSEHGTAWDYLPHDAARSRAYRWNEDGIAGICDRHQVLCFALAMWNGKDPILKERLFGLTGSEGNHGEDVKEIYHYLDSTPTHSFMRYLYKYPQAEFPYADLVHENRRRGREAPEYELVDTGVFAEDRYWDVFVEYAKADVEDILVRIEVVNRGPERATIELLPTLWFRNTWSWGGSGTTPKPKMQRTADGVVRTDHHSEGSRFFYCEQEAELLFTDNETNAQRLFGVPNAHPYVKDAFHEYVVQGNASAVNPDHEGTKCAARHVLSLGPGESATIKLRLSKVEHRDRDPLGADFDDVFALRRFEADEFYDAITPPAAGSDERSVMRQALAGVLWSKQYYHYVVGDWLDGDPAHPKPPEQRRNGRNKDWAHLYNADVVSMPDKWEYPWYAAWDLAFHCIPLAMVDADFAKEQLILLLREWYMHPNGQILMLNFTWWVNRKDADGRNVFQGGFLGLDNIGVFDRSAPLPTGGHLEQSDGTSWMAMYCLNMLAIALELAREDPAYEDVASKFWEHFVFIAHAMNTKGLWHEGDGFYYDVLNLPSGEKLPLTVRSMVGLIPLFAVETLDFELLERLPAFKRRLEWFIDHRPDLTGGCGCMRREGEARRRIFAVVDGERLRRVLRIMLDETEFLSKFGVRAISRRHRDEPFVLPVNGVDHRVTYEPGESSSGLFGGNSNWRGPIWFPVNFLILEALQKFHHYYGDDFRVEMPTGSGTWVTLEEAAAEISRRLTRIFLVDESGRRPVFGANEKLQTDPNFSAYVPFHEYFHGDDGSGVGARAQTGWTALVAKLIQQSVGAAQAEDDANALADTIRATRV
jgi:hypothetical protein